MASTTEEKNGRREAEARSERRDFKWAVEWLVKQEGQRRTAEILGVNRKTVAQALRRERLTGRMTHAVQTLLANLDDPVAQEVMPLDRIESQVGGLVESVDEIYRLIDRLALRVEALEEAQPRPQTKEPEAESDDEAVPHEDEETEGEEQHEEPAVEPALEREQTGQQIGWRRRSVRQPCKRPWRESPLQVLWAMAIPARSCFVNEKRAYGQIAERSHRMKQRRLVIEGSREVADIHNLRLMALLQELERDHGRKKAAELLGVDRRTLDTGLDEGVLSRRMRAALDRALQYSVGSAAAEQRDRNDEIEDRLRELEGKVEEQGKEMRVKHRTLEDAIRAGREENAQEHRKLEKMLAEFETGRDGQDGAKVNGAGPQPGKRSLLRREYPDLVTLEPAEVDEEVFGEVWPLIVEWRELKAVHPDEGKSLS